MSFLNRLILTFAVTLLFACGKGNDEVQNTDDAIDVAKFTNLIEAEQTINKVPGLQLVYKKKGQLFTYTKGVKNVNTNENIDANTVFQAASMSKVVAAYVFLKLVDKGVLNLDVPLSQYYKYNRLVQNANNLSVTARHVLLHTSGFVNWTSTTNGPLDGRFTPGTSYLYSGEGFQYLQYTVEHLTGKKLNELAIEEVFKPFGMTRSAFYMTDELVENKSSGHDGLTFHNNIAFAQSSANAAFSLTTTATDYAKFLQKVFLDKEGLSNTLYTEMVKVGLLQKNNVVQLARGLGIGIQSNEKGKSYFHGGSNAGYRALFIVYPDDNEFFVFLANSSTGYDLRKPFCNLFFGSNQTQYFLNETDE